MASTSSTHFEREKRRRGTIKHSILRSFTDGWFPRMSIAYKEKLLVYVDGFAGAGKHSNSSNDVGSPLLICDALARHTNLQHFASCVLVFTEKHKRTFEKLVKNIHENMTAHNADENVEFVFGFESETFEGKMKEAKKMFHDWRSSMEEERPKIIVIVEHGEFNEKMTQILEQFCYNPMFIFADPFGWNVPMKTFHKILRTSNGSAPNDILINLMDGNIRRFIASESHQASITAMLGECPPPRSRQWHQLSPKQKLKHIYANYVKNMKAYSEMENNEDVPRPARRELLDVKFAIKDKNNAHVYHLVFFCSHVKSLKGMKYAMYRNTQDYKEFQFSEWTKWNVYRNLASERAEMAQDTFERIKKKFGGKPFVMGATLENYIWIRTSYYFNFKPQLKAILKRESCVVNTEENRRTRSFNNILYQFGDSSGSVAEMVNLEAVSPAMLRRINVLFSGNNVTISRVHQQEALSTSRKRKRQPEASNLALDGFGERESGRFNNSQQEAAVDLEDRPPSPSLLVGVSPEFASR